MNINKISYIVLLVLLVFSCRNENQSLELTLLSDNLVSYCKLEKCWEYHHLNKEEEYKKNAVNKVSFKITNNTLNTYLLIDSCFNGPNSECLNLNEFIKLSEDNFIFTDSEGKEPVKTNIISNGPEEYFKYISFDEKVKNEFYSGTGYANKSNKWKSYNSNILESIVKIYPGETLFFEAFIYLPLSWRMTVGGESEVLFDKNKHYNARLVLSFNGPENIEDWLLESQIKTIRENNYKIFNGNLTSINQIPIIFN